MKSYLELIIHTHFDLKHTFLLKLH